MLRNMSFLQVSFSFSSSSLAFSLSSWRASTTFLASQTQFLRIARVQTSSDFSSQITGSGPVGASSAAGGEVTFPLSA